MTVREFGKITLYHLTSPEAVEHILREGIKTSTTSFGPPQRRNAVFAYDEGTLREIARYHRPDDKAIEFQIDIEKVWVGDLRLEMQYGDSSYYDRTFMPLKNYLQLKRINVRKHYEPEMVIPERILPIQIIRVREIREFI